MHTKIIVSVVLGVLLGAVAAIAVFPEAREKFLPQSQTQTSGKALIGGPFTLTDASGKTVTDADYRGRYMLVFFGFTGCPDICPAGLQLISAALDKVGAKADKVAPIFISVDPARDTVVVVVSDSDVPALAAVLAGDGDWLHYVFFPPRL